MRKTPTASVLYLMSCKSRNNLLLNIHLFLEEEASFLVSLKTLHRN